jgi:hypothetical protein
MAASLQENDWQRVEEESCHLLRATSSQVISRRSLKVNSLRWRNQMQAVRLSMRVALSLAQLGVDVLHLLQ